LQDANFSFLSSHSNAENGRQPSRGDKEPNVFHRSIHTENMPRECLKTSLTTQAAPSWTGGSPITEDLKLAREEADIS
jgi:hypothetical protein